MALLAALLLSGQAHAASTPETLLFESIGEMVSGLSYSHTVITVPLGELEQQIFDYRKTLEREFHQDRLQDLLKQAFPNSSSSSDPALKAQNAELRTRIIDMQAMIDGQAAQL